MTTEQLHESVLFEESVASLSVRPDDIVLDATLGGAGHFRALLGKLSRHGTIVGVDADADAIGRAQGVRDRSKTEAKVMLAHDNFRNIAPSSMRPASRPSTKALFDLGWSSFHLTSGRGFSFRANEPAPHDVRRAGGKRDGCGYHQFLPEETLADIFFTYGEERFARQIARNIVRARKQAPILTTQALADIVCESTPAWYQHRRIHPATKVFQALRIA